MNKVHKDRNVTFLTGSQNQRDRMKNNKPT